MVRISGARVQDVAVGEELDIPDLEDHMQSQLVRGGFQDAHGFVLRR